MMLERIKKSIYPIYPNLTCNLISIKKYKSNSFSRCIQNFSNLTPLIDRITWKLRPTGSINIRARCASRIMDDGVQLIIVRSKVREMTGQIFGRKWFPDESDFIESQEARTCTKTWDAASPRSFHRAGVQQVRQYRLIRPLSARHNSGRWPFRKRAQQYRSSRGMHSAHHLLSFLPSSLRDSSTCLPIPSFELSSF